MKHDTGTRIKLQVWNSQLKKNDYFDGVVTGKISATDRAYRVNVLLDNGISFRECAPECCIIKTT